LVSPYLPAGLVFQLAGLQHAGSGVLDLGEYVCNELASVRPTVVALAELGSTDFRALSQQERVDALVVIEQHRAWLDGLQQQVLAEVALGDTSEDKWLKEEVACALGLAPQTAGAKLKNAEQLCTRLPGTLGLLLEGRISELQARAVTEASYVLPERVLPEVRPDPHPTPIHTDRRRLPVRVVLQRRQLPPGEVHILTHVRYVTRTGVRTQGFPRFPGANPSEHPTPGQCISKRAP